MVIEFIKKVFGYKKRKMDLNVVKKSLEKKEEDSLLHVAGKSYANKDSSRFILQFNSRKKIEIIDKLTGNSLGDLADFYLVNGKPIVTSVKTMSATNLDYEIPDKHTFFPSKMNKGFTTKTIERLNAFKDGLGKVPEFIIMLPKGEATASKEIKVFLNDVRNAGFKAECVELEATNEKFEEAAYRISKEAMGVSKNG